MIPTEEQIRTVWEWAGVRRDGHFWYDPEGKQLSEEIPAANLPNLYRWPIPQLQKKGEVISLIAYECSGFACRIAHVFTTTGAHTISENDDPALAVFWAVHNAIQEEK